MSEALKIELKKILSFIKKHDLALATCLVIVVIAFSILLGWSNNKVVPLYPKAHYHYNLEPNNHLSFLSNWDGPDYLSIVESGYHTLFQANFFPLYPTVTWLVSRVIPSLLYSALIVAWVSLVFAVYFYLQIAKDLFKIGSKEALRASLLFLLFPTGIFLIATYSESLYAALSLGALYYTIKKKYALTVLLLLLCTATHITGMFVVLLVLLFMYEQKASLKRIIATGIVGSLGLIGYMTYCLFKFHNALAFIKSQQQIHGWLKHSYLNIITGADLMNVILIILLILSTIYWWNKRKSFSIYSMLFLLIPLVGRQYGGFNRYVLMAFPLQFMFYDYLKKKKDIFYYLLIAMAVGWTYFVLQYAGGYIGS